MRKHTIIEHNQFKQIIQYRPIVREEADRNQLKMTLLNSIINAIGEKWHRMKQETKSALEYLCFLSIERGFAYAGSQHVSERYDIDSSTVRRYISILEKTGVIQRIWRSSSKQNGRGKAVIFFTVHPYFKLYWRQLFFSHLNEQAHAQAEIVENTRIVETSDEPKEVVPYSSPELKINKNNNHLNVNHRKKGSFVKFVSKDVNRIAFGLFSTEAIKEAWTRVNNAFREAMKKFGELISNADRRKVAIITFNALKRYFIQRKGQMQNDEICALAYTIAENQFEQICCSRTSNERQLKIIRREMLPEWFEEHQQQFEQYCQQVEEDQTDIETRLRELKKRLAKYQ